MRFPLQRPFLCYIKKEKRNFLIKTRLVSFKVNFASLIKMNGDNDEEEFRKYQVW
jgi:hypothetical protein